MKKLSFLAFAILSISILTYVGQDTVQPNSRDIANSKNNAPACQLLLEDFVQRSYKAKLLSALEERKLVQRSYNSITIRKLSKSWLKNKRDSLHRFLKTLNRKKHSVYYLDRDETLSSINVYSDLFVKSLDKTSKIEKEGQAIIDKVDSWVAKYKNYTVDIKNLTDERVSLEFNIQLLKMLEKEIDKALDKGNEYMANITLMIDGKETPRRYIFRKVDANYHFELSKLIQRRKELDGGMFSSLLSLGEITNRIIDQARLHDIIRMHHRELEYYRNNTEGLSTETKNALSLKLEKLNALEVGYKSNKELLPSEFGVSKLQSKKIKTELMNLPKSIKSRDFISKSEKVVEKFMDEKSKDRLQYKLKGYAKVFKTTGAGAGVWAIFETGSLAKAAYVWWFHDKNRIDDCNDEAIDDDEAFRACLIVFIKEKYPIMYQLSMVNPNFDMFDLTKLPSNISKDDASDYSNFLEEALNKRAYYMLMIERDKTISINMEKSIKLKYEQMSKNLDLEGLHPCTTVSLDYLSGCMYKYLSKIFSAVYGNKKSTKSLKFDFRKYQMIPMRYRAQYIEEVEKVLNERTRYKEYKEELLNLKEYKSFDN